MKPASKLPDQTAAHWRDALYGAATEISKVSLGFSGATIGDASPTISTAGMVGAHIPMVGRPSYELSLCATQASCDALASAVLGMDVAGFPPSVVADAIGEIVNMLAGGVKRRLSGHAELELGLPIFTNGAVVPSDRLSVLAYPLQLGSIPTVAIIVGPR